MISTQDVVARLNADGISLVDPLTSGEVADVNAYLDRCTVYNAHVRANATKSATSPAVAAQLAWPAFTTDMEDIVTAPHIFEAALASMPIAASAFDEPPILYSMNAFWTHPSPEVYPDTHGWHRDTDDRKQLVLFVFGTDVTADEEGGHHYRVGSVRVPDAQVDQCDTRVILGPAGTAFMTNTLGMHMGVRPNKLRLLLWARWGVSRPPASYFWDKLKPVPRAKMGDRYPRDPLLQDAVRFVVQ